MVKLLIGMGSGRCGTRSLTKLLNCHDKIEAWHEHYVMLWRLNKEKATRSINVLLSKTGKPVKCDVGYYWLNYTKFLIEKYEAKIICLKRNKNDTVKSFVNGVNNPVFGKFVMEAVRDLPLCYSEYVTGDDLEKMDDSTREFVFHYWDEPLLSDHMFKKYFPQYEITDRQSYLERYWDDYYENAERYKNDHPENFMLIDVEDLNTKKGQNTIFDFIGVKRLKGEMICREGESRLKKGLAFLVK